METAQDEYDGYVHPIYGILLRHESRDTLVQHLWRIETEDMGLGGNAKARAHIERVVDRLLQLRDEVEKEG